MYSIKKLWIVGASLLLVATVALGKGPLDRRKIELMQEMDVKPVATEDQKVPAQSGVSAEDQASTPTAGQANALTENQSGTSEVVAQTTAPFKLPKPQASNQPKQELNSQLAPTLPQPSTQASTLVTTQPPAPTQPQPSPGMRYP